MNIKLVAAALLSASLAGGSLALAQDETTTSSTGDPSDYLTDENIQDFFTDENMKTMKSEDEVKKVFSAMTPDQQAKLKAACTANQESRFADLCKNIGTM
jgi:hypothetical protein